MELLIEMIGCVGVLLYWEVYVGNIKIKNPNKKKKFGIIGMICCVLFMIIGLTLCYYLK